MYVTNLTLKNVRSFQQANIQVSKSINVFVGQNNHGKSTLLNSIAFLQLDLMSNKDIRIGNDYLEIIIGIEGNDLSNIKTNPQHLLEFGPSIHNYQKNIFINIAKNGGIGKSVKQNSGAGVRMFNIFQSHEPNNLIYPFLSKRKVMSYSENVSLSSSNSVKGNFEDLYAKIDRLCNEDFQPAANEYKAACLNILGYRISTVNSENGKKAALVIRNMEHIPISAMGEGIANILGIIVDLCLAENKIFLVEELENDIHPKALKALLDLIISKSDTNQFFLSTHSNIVVKYLGAGTSTKIFKVAMGFKDEKSKLPISTIVEIEDNEEDRRMLLEELGYEFNDFGLWQAWLFLEESSAEIIIRDYLIPWFCKGLHRKLRTFSTSGITEMEPKFRDFNNLFVFLHLTSTYKNNAWVLVDDGKEETEILDKMKAHYVEKNGWNDKNFLQFSKHDFEDFFPSIFKDDIIVLKEMNKKDKRESKKNLINKVKDWISKDEENAKSLFSESAQEVIGILKNIEKQLLKK